MESESKSWSQIQSRRQFSSAGVRIGNKVTTPTPTIETVKAIFFTKIVVRVQIPKIILVVNLFSVEHNMFISIFKQ